MNPSLLQQKVMLLSIIVPYYNEPTLLQVIKNIYAVDYTNVGKFEVILVDDGSTDETTLLFEKSISRFSGIKLIKHFVNKGKGAAIKTGLLHCSGDIIIIQDADLEYNPYDICKVIQPILEKRTQVCYGSRHLGKEQRKRNLLWVKKHAQHAIIPHLGGKLITEFCNLLFFTNLTDVLTCYKAINASLLNQIKLNTNGFEMEAELTAKILKRTRILEVPIDFYPRTKSEGKKIRWHHGFKCIATIVKYRFLN